MANIPTDERDIISNNKVAQPLSIKIYVCIQKQILNESTRICKRKFKKFEAT